MVTNENDVANVAASALLQAETRGSMTNVKAQVKAAAATGKPFVIVNHEENQPGDRRVVIAIRVTDSDLWAKEYGTGRIKAYSLASIEVLPGDDTDVGIDANAVRRAVQLPAVQTGAIQAAAVQAAAVRATIEVPEPETLKEACQDDVRELERLGWFVLMSPDSISLHRYFKNGTPRKGADVSIAKSEFEMARPYRVTGPSSEIMQTFEKMASAIQLFADEAVKFAPNSDI